MGARGQGEAHTEQTASFSNPVGNLLRPPLRPVGGAPTARRRGPYGRRRGRLEPYSGRSEPYSGRSEPYYGRSEPYYVRSEPYSGRRRAPLRP